MAVNIAAGSRLFIGGASANQSDNDPDVGDFDTDSYLEVGDVEDLGQFGDTATEAKFTSLGNRRTRKFRAMFDAGNIPVTCGSDPDDHGQQAMINAFNYDLNWNFKVTLNDQLTVGGTPTTLYFFGRVMSKARNVGKVDNVVRQNFQVSINSPVIEVAAT